MRLTVLYRNEAERSALTSVFSEVSGKEYRYLFFGHIKSVDEYTVLYKYRPLAFLAKVWEVVSVLFQLLPHRRILFSTPHPSFRIWRFLNPCVRLYFYIRTLHIIEDSQSFSDRLSKRSKGLSRIFFFLNNYYSDYYYSPGAINNRFLVMKGISENAIQTVGLDPMPQMNAAPSKKPRFVIASQAWEAHGFYDTYKGEVFFISELANRLVQLYAQQFDIIIKLHPWEANGVYAHCNAEEVRVLAAPLTAQDVLIGGLSSYLVEQYLSGVRVLFFMHDESKHYYQKPVAKYHLPVCTTVSEVQGRVEQILSGQYKMEGELKFLRMAAQPPVYIQQLTQVSIIN